MDQPTTTLAILFADISGSTRLYETLGDALARQKVADCLSVLSEAIQQRGGTVIKTIGDEVMSTFPSAEVAVQAACAMQESLAERAALSKSPLTIRVGLHYGPALVEAADVFGDAVNLAARIVGLAKANQILTSRQTVDTLPTSLQTMTRHVDRAPLKGKQEAVDIYEVIWREDELTRMEGPSLAPLPTAHSARLRLSFGEQAVEVTPSRPSVSIGRGQENDLVIADEFASRLHARVELRRGKFVLLDQSTNGTFVIIQNEKPLHLHREELLLQGTGVISLGRPLDGNPPTLIHFVCEP
ncbi:MAG: adenylate/guanylate cyclase domain-containing protein [Deltaproteobacteria bacterium]|nr:adenylate/guanylate cyclase domain-containing protein [Deltaproteobacteria bacterium]